MKRLEKLRMKFFISFSDDWVALWELIRMVKEIYGFEAQNEIQTFVLKFIYNLLSDKLICVGFPKKGGNFDSWKGDSMELIQRIKDEWDALGKEPNIGDVVWFDLTEKGEAKLKHLQSLNRR